MNGVTTSEKRLVITLKREDDSKASDESSAMRISHHTFNDTGRQKTTAIQRAGRS